MAIPVKNTDGWVVGGQMTNATTGAVYTGTVTVFVSLDGVTAVPATINGGEATSTGNGWYLYYPSAAETNATQVAFTFTGSSAVPYTTQVPTVLG